MLDDYVKISSKGHKALVRGGLPDVVAAALIDCSGCTPAGSSGRGTVLRFPCGNRWGVIRKYLRGGVIRHFLSDSYLLHNRPLRELRLHDHVWRQGLPVPEPLGVCWQWRGPFLRGAIATVEIPARNLLDYLQAQPEQGVDAMRRCGELFRRMHDSGVWHADLQVRNVLVGEPDLYLIDLDNARLIPGMTRVQRARNLFRFRRSLEKNGLPLGLFDALCRGYGEESLPGWIGRIYHTKGIVSDAFTRSGDGH